MLKCSYRLVVVTTDADGNTVGRSLVSPGKSYLPSQRSQAEEDAKKVILSLNQRVEIESFIDPSRYAAGWARGWIF